MNHFQTDTPIYLQVVEEVKSKILGGQLQPGDKLESVREMASRLEVNPNTIQRAFLELEHQGFIVTQRAVGRFVKTKYKKRFNSLLKKWSVMALQKQILLLI